MIRSQRSAWECVEKPYFTTEMKTNNNKKQTRRKPKHGVPIGGRGQMPSKRNAAHALSTCHLVTVELGLWWIGSRLSLKSDSGLEHATEFLF